MRSLLLFALLVPCIALGAPRKVTVPADQQKVEQKDAAATKAPDKAATKVHGDPHVPNAPAKAEAKEPSKSAGATAK